MRATGLDLTDIALAAGRMSMQQQEMYDRWIAEFQPKLGATQRWAGFSFLAKELCAIEAPVVVETGSYRGGSWAGDGRSTWIWDWMVAANPTMQAFSVDASESAWRLCQEQCQNVASFHGDSLRFLAEFKHMHDVDLLFLDSWDYQPPVTLSELHCVGELAAAYHRLKRGALIAVDDCHPDGSGKAVLVRQFFERLGVAPQVDSYITIWRKPV